ncbi:sigma-70 family RNA polymerase sigma factor [Candidatus Pelagadaptatus aseana]|uniref:sigma-70 family RNA polymerase sigma factor n=1 Tax=Candidatus Pelagadaptatus aseana TaxID=3120508 RepID=UPI003C703F50
MVNETALNNFLQEIQLSAFRMAQVAVSGRGRNACREEALDIVQDAMIKFVEKYSVKSERDWRPLFFKTLNSRITDWHRRQKVRSIMQWFGHADEVESVFAVEQGPELQHHQQSALAELQIAMNQLPLRQQQAVMLRIWEGMSTAEAATAMGVSVGSVKTHLSRGLASLQQHLGGHWP